MEAPQYSAEQDTDGHLRTYFFPFPAHKGDKISYISARITLPRGPVNKWLVGGTIHYQTTRYRVHKVLHNNSFTLPSRLRHT